MNARLLHPSRPLVAACLMAGAAPVAAQAPPAWSHGIQDLRITYDECRQRADAALRTAGYAVDMKSGAWTGGPRGVNRAAIVCYGNHQGGTGVAIYIAANTQDPNVPGADRVRLQQLMADGGAPPPPAAGLAGNWNWSAGCPDGRYGGSLEIGPVAPDGRFGGRFSDIGSISGRMQAGRFEFRRTGQWGGRNQEQVWSASFTGNGITGGRVVRPTEGRGDCSFELTR
jgi:hypothetical protein